MSPFGWEMEATSLIFGRLWGHSRKKFYAEISIWMKENHDILYEPPLFSFNQIL